MLPAIRLEKLETMSIKSDPDAAEQDEVAKPPVSLTQKQLSHEGSDTSSNEKDLRPD